MEIEKFITDLERMIIELPELDLSKTPKAVYINMNNFILLKRFAEDKETNNYFQFSNCSIDIIVRDYIPDEWGIVEMKDGSYKMLIIKEKESISDEELKKYKDSTIKGFNMTKEEHEIFIKDNEWLNEYL